MTTNTPTAPLDPPAVDAAEIISFPQHEATPAERPRTIEDIIDSAAGMAPEQIMALVRTAFPQATDAEIARVFDKHLERLETQTAETNGETQAMADPADLCAPVVERGEASTLGEALQVLADEGNEAAAAFLAQIAGPDQQEFARLLELAVAEDPYWYFDAAERGYRVKPGARYSTPEELVAAYRQNHGLG